MKKLFRRKRRLEYREIVEDLVFHPAVRYAAAGLISAIVAKVASKMSTRYPEMADVIKENANKVERRLQEQDET